MADETNPFDMVQELSRAIHGETKTHHVGLLDKIESLSKQMDRLDDRLDRMESRKYNVQSWSIGYLSFCASGIFAVIAIFNLIPRTTLLDIPFELATFFSIVLSAIAMYFFFSGFGWIGRD